MKHKIRIVFEEFGIQKFTISAHIRKCIHTALRMENIHVPCEINVLVTNDDGIQVINRTSRNIDKPTDVLSFPMFDLTAGSPPDNWDSYMDIDSGMVPLGDMCISLERAKAQAEVFGHSLRREVGYLTIHSVLHLLGYDHMDEGEMKRQMRAREEAIVAAIPNMQRD